MKKWCFAVLTATLFSVAPMVSGQNVPAQENKAAMPSLRPVTGQPAVAAQPAEAVDSSAKKPVEGPKLDFGKKTEHDFGKIKEKGGKKTGVFTFKNSGNKPLVITKAVVSCSCTTISFSKKPVMPGMEGKIEVTYDPRKQMGVFHKAIQVYSNDPQARHIIFAKGEVVD